MMNIFLSLCVILSMLSGTAAPLPAVPDMATETVVRNMSVGINGESVVLAPELVLTEAIGSEMAAMRFEMRNGESILLPLAGEITAEGARFTLMDSGRIYTISEDTLLEILGVGEEDEAMLDRLEELYVLLAEEYQLLFSAEAMSIEESIQTNQMMAEAMNVTCEPWSIEVDGAQLDGFTWEADMDYAALMRGTEALMNSDSGNPKMQKMQSIVQELFQLIGEMDGTQVNSLSDMADIMPDQKIYMKNSWAEDGDTVYVQVIADQQVPDAEVEMRIEMEQIIREDVTDMSAHFSVREEERDLLVGMNVNGRIKGLITKPAMMDLDFDMEIGIPILMDSAGYETSIYSYTGIDGDLLYNNAEGRKNMQLAMDISESTDVRTLVEAGENYNAAAMSEEEVVPLESRTSLRFNSEENPVEGGVEGNCELAIDIAGQDAEPFALTFGYDYAISQVPAAEMLSGDVVMEITADFSGDAPAMLSIDALGLLADASNLNADSSILELGELLEPYMYADLDPYMYAYEDEYSTQTVYSEAEAAAIFGGEIPAYTPPEGYVLDRIEVDEWNYNAYYSNAEQTMELYTYYYGEDMFVNNYYQMQADGTLAAYDQPLVSFASMEDGTIYNASIVEGNNAIMMAFDPAIDQAELGQFIAGLAD